MLTAMRSVDIDLIEPIRDTTLEAKKQKKEERTISWGEKCCMVSLYERLGK